MRDAARQAAGVVTFIMVIVLNGLAGSGQLSGESIGTIANRYPTAFLPADYVFGIWGLIYLALMFFCIDQALPSRRVDPLLRRLGYLWPVNGALNVAWIAAFSFSRFLLAMLVMLALLANLVAIHLRIGNSADLSWRDALVVALPFGLYLSWISVAVIANTFQLATVLAWGGFGID
ncbi:MAG: tryptophan-rich sensory protein, partial [Gemmatimonadota bacterium]|nr:tryptophan-rich sensory protein [Gemmatimonadota bacterium]